MGGLVVAAALALAACGCGRSGAGAPGQAGAAGGPRASGAAAPAARTPWGETVVARVGDGVVTAEKLRRSLQREEAEAQRTGRPRKSPRQVLDQLVEQELLVQRAVRDGYLANDDDVRDRLARRVLTSVEKRLTERPDDAALRTYYLAHRADFPDEERLRLRHILVRVPEGAPAAQVETARRKAEEIRKEAARAPEKFADLARARSEDASRVNGGEIGYLPERRWGLVFGSDFAAAVQGLKPGQVTGVLRSRQGFHVVQLVDRSPRGADPLTVQRRELTARVQQEARKKLRDELMAKVRQDFAVSVDERALQAAADAVPPTR